MATNFGFMPVLTGKRYFISYKSEDSERVGEITRKLNEMGVPMWYDYGIEKGERWSDEINRNIEECEAFILFATRKLFAAEDTWVRKEFRLASMSKKKKYVVWLDDLNPYENPNDVHSKLKAWYVDVDDLQGIKMAGCSVDRIAWSMVTEFHLIQGKKPQSPSPTFQPSISKAEPQTVTSSQPVNQPKPATYTAPISQQSATVTKPVTAPVFRDSTPKKEKKKSITKKKVKYKPVIVTVAMVLVAAMLCGIFCFTNRLKSLSELDSVSVGGHFTFGTYPQGANGEELPIEWRVLAVESGKALVISEKLLDCKLYNMTNSSVTWETCTLRKWMNNDFISKAFSSNEVAKIATVTNQNSDNSLYETSEGNATQDKIFALSIDEAKKYFRDDKERLAAPTNYAKARGSLVSENYSLITSEKPGVWWLRSTVNYSDCAVVVGRSGYITQSGYSSDSNVVSVRPAFWLNL